VGATGNWTVLKSWSDVIHGWEDLVLRDFDIENPSEYYDYFRVVWTAINGNTNYYTANGPGYASSGEIEFLGLPEYDPEAHGTDVVVKSVPNVPNTDWLEVYYDAKDLEDGAISSDVTDLSTNTNDGSVSGNPQVSNGAFVFDGSGDYLSSTVTTTTGAGNWPHSYSFWMKADTDASSGAHFVALGTEGGAGSGTSVIRFSGENILWYFWSNDVTFEASNLRGRWVHIVGTYDGGSVDTSRKIFINNVEAPISSSAGTIGSLNLTTTSTPFKVGSQLSNTNTFKGSIANVRLFNRALTSDEVWQLYAYQKEYFGHGDLSMTLKAGRLGIGTSEPRAALDINSGGVRLNQELWVGSAKIDDSIRISTNTLSFYEEGSWKPELHAVSVPTYTEQFGYYTRIGNIVHLTFRITVSGLDNSDPSGIHITIPYGITVNNSNTALCGFGRNNTLFDEGLSNGAANLSLNYILPTRTSGNTEIKYNNCSTSGTILGFATYSLQSTT
jgi:hypothetical protein